MHNQKLLEAISPWLEIIDSELSLDEVSVSSRPVTAGIWLVKNAIKEISGGSKDDYFGSEWFSIFMQIVIHWYREKYGEGLLEANRSKIHCLVIFRGLPLLCEVPAATSKVEVEGETAWLSFPDSLQPDEETLALFPTKPRLESLNEQERLNYWEAVRRVVGLSRSSHLHLMLFECTDEHTKQMAAGIWTHIEKAVADICSLKPSRSSIACWETHLAIEKTFKVFLFQKTGSRYFGHDLEILMNAAMKCGLSSIPELSKLPHHTDAIKLRYGEESISILEAYSVYESALQIVHQIAKGFSRTWNLNNASFLLKKPNWV
jgi:HEPN domain-containing protein